MLTAACRERSPPRPPCERWTGVRPRASDSISDGSERDTATPSEKVEEKAYTLGESIDNSQLSRFEKGKALPSFDKLRALARIFNVSVQNFSDVLDLEEFESLKPECEDFDELLALGAASFSRGEHGRAFVAFEKALEVVDGDPSSAARIAEARWSMARR
jgi:transcriptional regulator with XRE-family HTH domain